MIEVVAAFIWDNNKFLICQRPSGKSCALLWEFVGGKVEPGEAKESALKRECREELGITLSVGEMVAEVTHDYPEVTIHLSLFNASITEGKPQLLEHNDFKWISMFEISDYEFCPADIDLIKLIKTV